MRLSRKAFQFLSIFGGLGLAITFNGCIRGFQSMDLDLSSTAGSAAFNESISKGRVLYTNNCQSCHSEITQTTIKNPSVGNINLQLTTNSSMTFLAGQLSTEDINNISLAVRNPNAIVTCNPTVAEFVNVQRLNNLEYNNVIRDLTGLDLKPADSFPKDGRGQVFTNTALALNIDLNLSQMYFDSATKVLDAAFAQARGNIVTCDPNAAAGHRACAEKVIREFGLKAFRRPLATEEVNRYLTRYDATRSIFPAGTSANQFDESLKASLQTILMAPSFLFRMIESTPGGGVRNLSAYELASRLSFFIWGSIPDQTLFNLAANGSILNNTVLTQQVDRMLKDPKSAHMVDGFLIQWLRLDSLEKVVPNTTVYPQFTESLRKAMLTESRMLLADIVQKDLSPYLLLNSTYTYVNSELGNLYGVQGPASGFAKVDLSSTMRRGVFGHASLLTVNSISTESSIVKRGLYFLRTFVCANPGMPPKPEPGDRPTEASLEGLNPREKLEAHVKNPKCATCHNEIDPPGFALENFDGIGKYRTNYSDGDRIDSSARLSTGELMSSPADMAAILSASDKFKSCFAGNLMTYALARDLLETDKCAADQLASMVVSKDKKFSDLVKEIVLSPQFLKQKGGN